jgi:N-hydroxyarylamine O-acetyltransferase
MHRLDLSAYLQRIGYTGPQVPTLPVLNDILRCHTCTIPFENLNPYLALPVSLDPAAVEDKLVQQERGGYCFEQNLLLWNALEALGYTVTGMAARVIWGSEEKTVPPRGHMLLKVDWPDHARIVDVGFGGTTPTSSLALNEAVEQSTTHETMRFMRIQDEWHLQIRILGEWLGEYRFDLQRQHPVDYRAANYFAATHPSSRFVTNLVAARAAADGRHTLFNRELSFHALDGTTSKRVLDIDEVADVLKNTFLIKVPDESRLHARLKMSD